MKTIAICNSNINEILPNSSIHEIQLHGIHIFIGLLDIPEPDYEKFFTPNSVLVCIKAFSCNYRDKSLAISFYEKCKQLSSNRKHFYSPFGSEFVAEVIRVGKDVKNLKIGDRVIPDGCYPYRHSGVIGGLPTNYASQRFQLFNEEQLVKIPESMIDEVAAGFTIAAQTSYSIIRKLQLKPSENFLITSANSNTSIALLNTAKKTNANIFVTSTNEINKNKLLELGAKKFIPYLDIVNKKSELKFDAVADPFFDISLNNIIPHMAFNSRYITCGLYEQHPAFDKITNKINFNEIMTECIMKNISLIGNCLGGKNDLEEAINDFSDKNFNIVIDSVFSEKELTHFTEKLFSNTARFGKIIYKYEH